PVVGNYILPVELRELYRKEKWEIVRNYDEFVDWIRENGIPKMISFDHDLADEHYHPAMNVSDEDYNVLYDEFVERTGYDCAKWLIQYCQDNYLDLPEKVICHSMNSVGRNNIIK